MTEEPQATIIVPTSRHAFTIDLTLDSLLHQTIVDIEVIVLGDGCDDATREAVGPYWRTDPRVRFMDLPKGPGRGEAYRNDAVLAARAPVIGYCCDDDLFFPDHVEDMLKLLADHDFAQSLNGAFRPDGSFDPSPVDLSDPRTLALHGHRGRSAVSLTGAFHTVAAFDRLPHGWCAPQSDQMTDHAMWRTFFDQPWLRAATSDRVTTVQLPGHLDGRAGWAPEDRRHELERWARRIALPAERAAINEAVVAGFGVRVSDLMVQLGEAEDERDSLRRELEVLLAGNASQEAAREPRVKWRRWLQARSAR